MRSDLDRLMKERGLAGVVVYAHDRYSPSFYYATGQKMHHGIYFRAADGRAHVVHDVLEPDQAAAIGCDMSSFAQQRLPQLAQEESSAARAVGRLIADMLATLGILGRVSFAGDMEMGYADQVLTRVRELQPGIEVDPMSPSLLQAASITKDAAELESIRRASRGTARTMEIVRAFLGGLKPAGDHFTHQGDGPVTLGNLRKLIHLEYAGLGLAENGESIVSQGRDCGVPHNRGNDAEPLRAGTPILIDIFPCEAGGGYHSDMTRTFCIGPAPPELRKLYDDVRVAYEQAMGALAVGELCRSYQERTCDTFEARGHPTMRTNSTTTEGYVHSLGHGVGLAVHEAPRLGGPPTSTEVVTPGQVFSVEPGLYYPSKNLGVRIEDLVAVCNDGTFENLTKCSIELEVEPRG